MMTRRAVQGFLPMKPPSVTHNDLVAYILTAGPRKGRPAIRKSDRLKDAEEELMSWMKTVASVGDEGFKPLAGPLRLTVRWCYEVDDKHKDGQAKTTKPDISNMLKTFEDCLTRVGIIADDALIVDEHLSKAYKQPYGVWFKAEELRESTGGKHDR